MSQYKIVIDSCGELPEDLKADGHFCTVPLLLDVDGYQITDDETFNQRDFLQRVKACIHSPKSSCPSPERYMSAYEGEAEHVYVVTLSGKLSGSYNSAVLAHSFTMKSMRIPSRFMYLIPSRPRLGKP